MTRSGTLAALVVLLAPLVCPGQDNPPPPPVPFQLEPRRQFAEEWTVKIETFNNKGVTGKIRLVSVAVDCDLGLLQVRLDKIKAIQLVKIQESRSPFEMVLETPRGIKRDGSVITTSGESITGTIYVPNWEIETELGTLSPDAKRLKTITFLSKTKAD